jgi:hypothetical protein
MQINWSALALVFLVSLGVTILVIVLFALSVVALGKDSGPGRRALAIGGFALCGVVTLFGIAVILA